MEPDTGRARGNSLDRLLPRSFRPSIGAHDDPNRSHCRAPGPLASLLHLPSMIVTQPSREAVNNPGGNMWKKDEGQAGQESMDAAPRASAPRSTSGSSASGSGRATIGPSISIKGDVTGSEDLLIQGKVDGSVTLGHHAVSVGSEGRVNANIVGRVITIEGRVEGDLTAEEQIILRGSAQVHGDIKAPRVVLEDGATFRGLVDMGATPSKSATTEASGTSSQAKPSEPLKSTSGSISDASKQATSKSGQASS